MFSEKETIINKIGKNIEFRFSLCSTLRCQCCFECIAY